ncbi:enoyl-CoA hydratase [Rhodococcus sp. ACPA4]|uniref:Crotonase/enoyl-CoA hydratase family protein n=3 Tax=Nocardiaceae TaxID=85025 RepID=A0ABU4C205_RHOGO|nr:MULTISPECIES: crotonase/enoyl-CoA hydratase family protein [Rhodococcus]NMD64302.1 crotonase/enoyl-CoA hydratase family protein [Nocardia globerula]MCE4265790.1 crotonase/enoyl-CoA hydratase family protein [Rhodococcus globerulus]MDV6270512.1 crotonase/enoyl-CoA hydratase family protein [Rhodococcus globerulus]MDV8071072.1 crotonase/enoyl-CoA hydratase family protein [Rhodococcus sp. IEGM 1366]NRI70004.1 crotonase/enoyl-CoA hydratase family protein [Rhodococcus sp. MS16]
MSETNEPAVLVERVGNVMVITINRPSARNAVNSAVSAGVGGALDEAAADPDVRAIVLTGAGEKSFCAGADLKAISRGESVYAPNNREWGFAGFVNKYTDKPTIAAVNGTALGGGTELAMSADLIVAAENATFGLPEVKRGLIAGAGGVFRLPEQMPQRLAMEMIFTGDPISAARALEVGLINQVVPEGQVVSAAVELAQRIAVNAPLSVQASKRVAYGVVDSIRVEEADRWVLSAAEWDQLATSEDSKEGPRAFAEKREPVWKAR